MTKKEPLKIGVTGGIGSGKSTICRIFEILGCPVYNSDQQAIHLIHNHPEIIEGYIKLFGKDVYNDGILNRKLVADKIFNEKQLLIEIQNLVHPIVRNDFNRWFAEQTSAAVINEAAILFESGSYKQMDKIISVIAPEQLRIDRVVKRDRVSPKEVTIRIKNQWTDDQRIPLSDYIIYADDQQLVTPQVIEIYEKMIETFTS
ncbi:dephospho-CoA kinase [Natronoflexus pectinivorans]|uniref:Dephospho-CoA kinase n=1 Tax=Natronoflexus pectinivorans TaxID=682526 RepID=A0A4R2G6P4_9BACT|nr:dephospho-CoA kinase [Natronoflexus pectinivorans]TCO03300.1 dephospho-CoA kinase [Natronoflexus pectinivorans]